MTASYLDQNPSHGIRGGSKEMTAALPTWIVGANQSKVSLVNQGSGLQRMAWELAAHSLLGNFT
jgi:hypothetical protein